MNLKSFLQQDLAWGYVYVCAFPAWVCVTFPLPLLPKTNAAPKTMVIVKVGTCDLLRDSQKKTVSSLPDTRNAWYMYMPTCG